MLVSLSFRIDCRAEGVALSPVEGSQRMHCTITQHLLICINETGSQLLYVIQCKDGFYYTGITNQVEKRVAQHNEGKDVFSFTHKRRRVTLNYFQHFKDVKQAIAR